MKNLYVLPNETRVVIRGKDAFIVGNNKTNEMKIEDVSYSIKFVDENTQDYNEIIKLSDIEGVWILPYYTKVEIDGRVGFIMWSDEETSEEDLSDLNYLIKFGDNLDDILKDKSPQWYDDGFLHHRVKVIA